MSVTFEQVLALFPDAEVVGGDVIVKDGLHRTVVGMLRGGSFNLTAEGQKHVQEKLAEPPAVKRRGRAPVDTLDV